MQLIGLSMILKISRFAWIHKSTDTINAALDSRVQDYLLLLSTYSGSKSLTESISPIILKKIIFLKHHKSPYF